MVVHLRSRVQLGQEKQYQHHDPLQETNIGDATIPIVTSTLKFNKKVKVENCYAYLSPMTKRVLLLLPLAIWLLILTVVTKRDAIDMTFTYRDGGGEAEKYVNKGNPPSENDAQKQKTKPPASSISAAEMANNHLRDKGVLLRTKGNPAYAKHFDENGRDYLPTSFVHASMRAPNVVFRKDKYAEARVAYLIASKFERHSPVSELPNKVDCRAYYPVDAWSGERDHKIFNNLVGTSCKPQRQKKILSSELYNATNRYVDVCKIMIDSLDKIYGTKSNERCLTFHVDTLLIHQVFV